MKIDRLLGIIMYLLNRKTVSASELAEQFEVSVRTIQRDIDALSSARIPIFAVQGASGGYGIMETYTLDKQIIDTNDFFFIVTALKGLCSAYENKKMLCTLEKIVAVFSRDHTVPVRSHELYIDFTAFRESASIKENFPRIEKGIQRKRLLEFDYTSSDHTPSFRQAEPMTIVFKWYAWYLIAYCRTREDYRLFCISRMRNIRVSDIPFTRDPIHPEDFFSRREDREKKNVIRLKLLFDLDIKVAIETHFPNSTILPVNDRTSCLDITLPRNEPYWLGMIMSFGNKVKILEPEYLKDMLVGKTAEIAALYRNS